MTTRTKVLEVTGKQVQETAELLGNRVIRAIFVVEEPTETTNPSASSGIQNSLQDVETILAEMDTHAVHAGEVDDSREAVYTRREGE